MKYKKAFAKQYFQVQQVNGGALIGIARKYKNPEERNLDKPHSHSVWVSNGKSYSSGLPKEYTSRIENGSIIEVELDMHAGTLSYKVDGIAKGIAVSDKSLKEGEWYPTAHFGMNADSVRIK